jgi:sigma-B regulation protein RsbU (phosphoserine phosphatase)
LPVLLIRKKGGEEIQVERLKQGGLVLGVVKWGNYHQCSVRIEEGDLLIMFSDGILEAMNGELDHFGEERLLNVIRNCPDATPIEIQDAILNAVHAHAHQDHLKHDDRTLMVIRFHSIVAGAVSAQFQELSL